MGDLVILNFGVVDLPYSSDYIPAAPKRVSVRRTRHGGKWSAPRSAETSSGVNKTTGEVAQILEDKYHIMEIFFNLHSAFIGDEIAESYAEAVESLLMGGPGTINPSAAAMSSINDDFNKFLALREMDGLGYPGVPTQAALRGVSHRFAHPYARRPSRPSFVDTGLYRGSFRAWTDM